MMKQPGEVEPAKPSLYERMGGENALWAAATLFYERVVADARVARFFDDLDVEALVRKQVAFMTWAFGGPGKYQYRPLDEAHARLVREEGLSDEHFDAVCELLEDTLVEMELPRHLIDEALAIVAGTRSQVLGR